VVIMVERIIIIIREKIKVIVIVVVVVVVVVEGIKQYSRRWVFQRTVPPLIQQIING